jgi:steroid 5-alpha reductase family enzyme
MFDLHIYLAALLVVAAIAVVTWLVSLWKRDVSIVDSMWSLLLLAAAGVYVYKAGLSPRGWLMLSLTTLWALRLTIYITARNWGEPEDHRYQEIRARNEPHFAFKSLYIVFLLQAVLAWVVSLPLLSAATGARALGTLDYAGALVVIFGIAFESIGDAQLAKFKADARNRGRVLDTGLWRYTRHPNYFGECCVWWGFYLLALATGGWWSVIGPLLMTILLLKVSGVSLLEKDIGQRRPQYREYVQRTNAFIPGPRKTS